VNGLMRRTCLFICLSVRLSARLRASKKPQLPHDQTSPNFLGMVPDVALISWFSIGSAAMFYISGFVHG